jgi:hypothetical protein
VGERSSITVVEVVGTCSAIPEHFEPGPQARPGPGPPTNLAGRAWAEILKPAKNFWPEPGLKIEARCIQWDGHGQDFFDPK